MRRAIAGAVLVFSASVSVALPVADGYAEQASEHVHAHVEQPGSSHCPRPHYHVACQICSALRLVGAKSTVQFRIPRRSIVNPAALRRLTSTAPTWRSRAASPRAPPAAIV